MKERTEIAVQDTWDLTKVYKSDTDWYQEYEEVKESLPRFREFKETMMNSGQDLYGLLKFDQDISRDRKSTRLNSSH